MDRRCGKRVLSVGKYGLSVAEAWEIAADATYKGPMCRAAKILNSEPSKAFVGTCPNP
jgi:hypothetical protein